MNKENQDYRFRGEGMNRIETFVAAAFAFAVSMLVISVDSIPSNFVELKQAAMDIPAFAASFAIMTWIWHEHAMWCKKFGLEDARSVMLSCLLVFLVLVYIYPLRLMMQGLFGFLSGGLLPFNMEFEAVWQVRFLFGFYALGFLLLSLTFTGLYNHVLKNAGMLDLSEVEHKTTKTEVFVWLGAASISFVALVLAIVTPVKWLGFTGFIYFLLFPLNFIIRAKKPQ